MTEIEQAAAAATLAERERCARIARGVTVKDRYRAWPWMHQAGDPDYYADTMNDGLVAKHSDAIAAAILDGRNQ